MEAQLQELGQFLRLDSRPDLKATALNYVLGLTGSDEGRSAILKCPSIVTSLLDLTTDQVTTDVSHNAYLALVNLSGYDTLATQLIKLKVIPRLIELLTVSSDVRRDADSICKILSNLTRLSNGAEQFMASLEAMESAVTLYKLVDMFDKRESVQNQPLDYLASVFSNITGVATARSMFLDKQVCILPRLLPYMHYKDSPVRRAGIIGLVRNLCFETSYHNWLLSPEVDVLSCLLLPLAGSEQFTDEENDSLPMDLQYLPDDKEREIDPSFRKMLLESLMKLCATKDGRQYLRDKNTYLILRELDRWEQEELVTEVCQNVISILISDDPDPTMEDLDKVVIPEDVARRFEGDKEGCGNSHEEGRDRSERTKTQINGTIELANDN